MTLILALLTFGVGRITAQKSQPVEFSALVNIAIELSDRALFNAKFNEALDYLDTTYFSKFDSFQHTHRVQLTLQKLRVLRFRNLLFQIKPDSEENLQTLLNLEVSPENLDRKNVLAEYYLALSSAYRSVGNEDSGALMEAEAMKLFQELEDFRRVADVRAIQVSRPHNKLLAAGEKQMIIAMIPEYEEEIEYSERYNKYALSFNTRHLAQVHRRQTGNWEEALRLFNQSLELRQEIGFKPYIPASHSSIGDVYLAMEDYQKSIEAYKRASELAEGIGFIRYQIYPIIQIGDIYLKQGDKEQAREYFQKALNNAIKNEYTEGVDQASKRIESLE